MRINNDALDGLLAQRGMTRAALAHALGISAGALSKQYKQNNLRTMSAHKIAAALGVDPKYIVVGGESLPDIVPVADPVAPAPSSAEPPKPKREAKPKEPPPAWMTDFETYKKEGWEAIQAIVKDANWMQKMEEYHPRLDILKSVEKSWNTYWGTEEGWKKKKKVKARTIDWKSTLGRTIQFSGVQKSNLYGGY